MTLALLISTALWLACTLLGAMLLWFTIEVVFGLKKLQINGLADPLGDCAVIVPAHDEAFGLAAMLRDLPQEIPRECVLLVADNCSDETASIARAAGVRVIERDQPERRGKGFALAFARDHLAADPPAAVMVLDADCRIARGDPFALAGRAVGERVAVQAENLQRAGAERSVLVRLGAFAFLIKNLVRARGLERIGGGAFLQGTGMVLPWGLFARVDLASGSAVEDVDLTVQLACIGAPVRLDPRCRIESLAAGTAAHLAQRERWEHGFIRNGIQHGLPMIFGGSRLRFALGCHMLVPPLALLFLLTGVTMVAGVALASAGSATAPVAALAILVALAGAAILVAWRREGREALPLRALLLAPGYMLWKLPVYLALPFRRARWTRTERVSESGSTGGSAARSEESSAP